MTLNESDDHTIDSEKRKVKNRGVDDKLNIVTNQLESKFKLDGSTIVYESDEEVVEGIVTGRPDNQVCADNMPDPPAAPIFQDENGVDSDNALQTAFRQLERLEAGRLRHTTLLQPG